MLYLGGKGRTKKAIRDVILERAETRVNLLEPFIGGGSSFEALAPHFERLAAGDSHEDLMLMWTAVAAGWEPPVKVTEAEYAEQRRSAPSALRGFVGFGCSYGGKWWGGYARNKYTDGGVRSHPDYYASLAARSVLRIAPLLTRADLRRASFEEWDPVPGTVVYADPEYAGTTRYKVAFDSAHFWNVMAKWRARGCQVFVSEYAAPPGWTSIWRHEQRRKVSGGTGANTVEQLWI